MALDYRALIFVILAIILFGVGDFATKILAKNATGSIGEIIRNKTALMSFAAIAVFGIGGFLSWMMALKFGDLSRLVPLQKLSLLITVLLAILILHEAWSWKTITGTAMAVGAILLLM